jgi:hypothetical protein
LYCGIELDFAKRIMLSRFKKICEIIVSENLSFESLSKLPYIKISYTEWSNNIKNGRYHAKDRNYIRYKWIQGKRLLDYPIYNEISIRYDPEMTSDEVKHNIRKILKRHANKFLKELLKDKVINF